MSICIPFVHDFPWLSDVQELTAKFNADEDMYLAFADFLLMYPDHRINMEITSGTFNIDELRVLTQLHSNLYLMLNEEHAPIGHTLQEYGITKYFYNLPATNWDALHSFIQAGVSDVYITGELGFSWDKVRAVVDPAGIRTRVIVNIAQSTDPMRTNDQVRSFFIRPEDMQDYLFEYIDTVEFYHEDNRNKLNVLYEAYVVNQSWFGNLSEIISNLEVDVDNKAIVPDFAFARSNCGKRCYKGTNCDICYRAIVLARALSNVGQAIERQ